MEKDTLKKKSEHPLLVLIIFVLLLLPILILFGARGST